MQLRDNDVHHLARVLRLRPNETVSASDGRGNVVQAHWDGSGVAVDPSAELCVAPAPVPAITVAFSLTKGSHPEQAVQKLTECGVDEIAVVISERSVARWPTGAGAERQMARLDEVARQAAMQCRRAWLPRISGPFTLDAFARQHPGLALAEPGGKPLSLSTPVVAVGPEGGWSEAELGLTPNLVGLGPHVLRAETAAAAAGILLSALRAGLVASNAPRASGREDLGQTEAPR